MASSNDIPDCNRCGAHISWNKTRRGELGTTRPLTPDNSKIHECEEVTNNSSRSNNNNNSNDNITTTTADQQSHIQKIEEYSLVQVEELKRQTDILLTTSKTQGEELALISQYLKIIATSIKNQEQYLESILKQLIKEEYKEQLAKGSEKETSEEFPNGI